MLLNAYDDWLSADRVFLVSDPSGIKSLSSCGAHLTHWTCCCRHQIGGELLLVLVRALDIGVLESYLLEQFTYLLYFLKKSIFRRKKMSVKSGNSLLIQRGILDMNSKGLFMALYILPENVSVADVLLTKTFLQNIF